MANADVRVVTAESLEKSEVSTQAFGVYGPLGAYGPLGTLGPIGNQTWNPSVWLKMVGDWSDLSNLLTQLGGPLSANGPLGKNGSLGDQYSNFPAKYRAGGAWAVVGPAGPLGALGPLGPLGPLGAHGFSIDEYGHYRNQSGRLMKSVSADYDGSRSREFFLFEVVDESSAKNSVNDTSVLILGEVARVGGEETFQFESPENGYVTVLVVPEKQLDDFSFSLISNGLRIAESAARRFINFAHFRVSAGARFQVKVKLRDTDQFLSHTYRLIVLGAPQSALH